MVLQTYGSRVAGNAGCESAGWAEHDPSDLKTHSDVWNFGIQRELPGHNVLDVAYVGTRGTRLFINEQLNPGTRAV